MKEIIRLKKMSAILVILSTLLSLSVPFVQPLNHAFAESNPQKADTFYWDNEQGFRITDQNTKTDFIGTDGGPKHAYAAGDKFTCQFRDGTDINGAALSEFFGRRVVGTANIEVQPHLIDVRDWQQPYYDSKDIYLYNISTKSNNGETPICVINDLGSINVTKAPDDITPFTYESSYLIKGQNEFKDQTYNIVGPKTDNNSLDYDTLKKLNAPIDEKSKNTVYYKNGNSDCANYIVVNVKSSGSGTLYQQARNPQSNNDCQLGAMQAISVPCTGSGSTAGAICAPGTSTVFVAKEPQNVSISRTNNFKASEAKKPPDSALASNVKPPDDTQKEESGCSQALTPFGWILCPITDFADDLVQWFQNIVKSILYISPAIFTVGNPLYNSWRIFSNLASALIVLIALVMIAGQIFNFEIFSAYTVKKVLPRLIIGAILIQLSWFLTTTLVELVNAIGTGLYWLLLAPFKYTGNASGSFIEFNQVISYGGDLPGDIKQVFGNAGGLAVGIIAAGAFIKAAYFTIIMAAIGVIISLVVALITLMVRAMLVILLIVIAPVAIAAWILPGTQRFWDMWWKMFSRLLMMFPLIMLLFAGGVVAGSVLAAAAKTTDQPGISTIMNFAVLIAYFAPIFMISMTYKFAGTAFASIASMGDKLGKKASGGGMFGLKGLAENQKKSKAENRKSAGLERAGSDNGYSVFGRQIRGTRGLRRSMGRMQAGTAGYSGSTATKVRESERMEDAKNAMTELNGIFNDYPLAEHEGIRLRISGGAIGSTTTDGIKVTRRLKNAVASQSTEHKDHASLDAWYNSDPQEAQRYATRPENFAAFDKVASDITRNSGAAGAAGLTRSTRAFQPSINNYDSIGRDRQSQIRTELTRMLSSGNAQEVREAVGHLTAIARNGAVGQEDLQTLASATGVHSLGEIRNDSSSRLVNVGGSWVANRS